MHTSSGGDLLGQAWPIMQRRPASLLQGRQHNVPDSSIATWSREIFPKSEMDGWMDGWVGLSKVGTWGRAGRKIPLGWDGQHPSSCQVTLIDSLLSLPLDNIAPKRIGIPSSLNSPIDTKNIKIPSASAAPPPLWAWPTNGRRKKPTDTRPKPHPRLTQVPY